MAPGTAVKNQEAISDDELLARIGHDRDHDAFTLFFDRHKSAAFNLAKFMTRDQALAEEAVQEAMLVVWKNAERYEPGRALGWLRRIIARRSYWLVQKAQRKKSVITESEEMLRAAPAREDASETDHAELHTALRRCMSDLPLGDRLLIALYYGSGLSQVEIAAELEMPQRTVSDRLKRVLGLLRSRLGAAGFAAAAPMLDMNVVNVALTTGEAVPHGLQAGALKSTLSDAVRTSARELSRRVAPPAFGTGTVVLACALIVGGGGAYLLLNPNEPIASEEKTDREEKPVDLSKAPPVDVQEIAQPAATGGVNRTWHFADGPDDTLKVLNGPWIWQPKKGRLDAGMAGPVDDFVRIILPVRFPRQPFKVTLNFQWNVSEKNARAGAVWCIDKPRGVPKHIPFARKIYMTKIPERSQVVAYFFDRWVVEVPNGTVGSVREFPEPYPLDTVCVYFINRVTQSIEAKTITMEDIPADYRDPKKLIQRDGLTPQDTDLPPPLGRW